MKRETKSYFSFGVVGLFVLSLIASLTIGLQHPKAYAGPSEFDPICIPPTTLQGSAGYTPNGWLSITVVNRAQMKIDIVPTGNCANQNRSMDSVLGESPGKMKNLLEELITDVDISDNTWGYRSFADGFGGDQSRDQTYLDMFNESAMSNATKDPFGSHNAYVDNAASALAGWSGNSQLVFAYEPDAFAGKIGTELAEFIAKAGRLSFCDDSKNIGLYDEGGYGWNCTKNTQDRKGLLVRGVFKDAENFNIVYIASADGSKLTHVSKDLEDTQSFQWCGAENFTQPNGEKGRYRTSCAVTTSGYYLEGANANPKAMIANAASNLIDIIVRQEGSGSPGYKTSVAGSTSTAASASNSGGAGSGGVGSVADGDVEPSCETVSGFNLSWILCPVINGLAGMSQGIFSSVIEPYLKTDPISTVNTKENVVFKMWSSFRTIGNIVLIFGLLFIVFGQAIGGGLIDAYTAKKALPRIIVVAILINLSIYLVAIMVDITNIIGAGIGALITAPLRASDNYKFSIGGGTAGTLGAVAGVAALAVFLLTKIQSYRYPVLGPALPKGEGAVTPVGSGGFIQFFLLFVLLPVALITISIFATLIIRRGLIMFLVIMAPVALAMYILPQTEKYAKKWFSTLITTLAVYPVIVAIFSIAYVLSLTTISANGGQSEGTFSQFLAKIIGLVVLFIPLVMIPFAFKLAGGAVANLYGTLTGAGKRGSEMLKGNPNDAESLRNQTRTRAKTNLDYKRFAKSNQLKARSADASFRVAAGTGRRTDRLRSSLLGRTSRMVGGAGIEARVSANQAAESKRLQAQKSTGPDDSMRDAWAEYDETAGVWWNPLRNDSLYLKDSKNGKYYDRADLTADASGMLTPLTGAVGRYDKISAGVYRDSSGVTHGVNSLGINRKAVVSSAAVQTARRNSMGNPAAFQESLNYEMEKVSNNDDLGKLEGRYARLTKESGISAEEASSVWKVVGYRQSGTHLIEKFTGYKDDAKTGERTVTRNLDAFAKQFGSKGKGYEKSGNQDRDWGFIDADIKSSIGTLKAGGTLDKEQLERMRHYHAGISALDRGSAAGVDPSTSGPPPPGTGLYFSTGGSGVAEIAARKAYVSMNQLKSLDSSVVLPPQGTGDTATLDNRG